MWTRLLDILKREQQDNRTSTTQSSSLAVDKHDRQSAKRYRNKPWRHHQKKSTVNKAGNYTKPSMRKRLFSSIKSSSKGGKPGQWSARKAQMLAKQYKAKGGGYK